MERIHALIEKLQQQKNAAAPPDHLLFTVQLLHQELSQWQATAAPTPVRKVCVTLPVNVNFSAESLRVPYTDQSPKEVFVLAVDAHTQEEPEESPVEQPAYTLAKPPVESLYREPLVETPRSTQPQTGLFNTALESAVVEAPTLPFEPRVELHERIGQKKESLNDRLKAGATEVAHLLKDTPIKDLRKGIGINDRFVFVKELFRGDEAMYERSVKTINGFNIFSEADYWMARELKHKLGWNEDNATVKQFYGLVRRRFS